MPTITGRGGRAYLPAMRMRFAVHAFYELVTNPVCLLLPDRTRSSATAFLQFTKGGKGQKLIHSLKYHGNKKLGYELGTHGRYHLPGDRACHRRSPFAGSAAPAKNRQRGYNQSEWIAYGIRSDTGIAIDTHSLARTTKDPNPQGDFRPIGKCMVIFSVVIPTG